MRFAQLALLALCPAALSAQVDFTLLGGLNSHSIHAQATEPDGGISHLAPDEGTGLALAMGLQRGAWRASVTVGQ